MTGEATLSDDRIPQVPPRSTPDRGQHLCGSSSSNGWWLLVVGLIAALLCMPFFRAIGNDEGVLLNGAERIFDGDRLYADFFEFLPPGGFVFTKAWFSIAGISVGSARSLAILIIVGIACFTYLACQQASKNSPLSALLATGWVVMLLGSVQFSHHWLTTLFSMVAAWAALANIEHSQRRLLRWPLIAGVAAGTAAMVTPHRGALAMMAAMTGFLNPRQHRPEFIAYVLGCALTPAGLLAYVVWHHALSAAFDDVIVFTLTRYAAIQSVPFGWGVNPPLKYLFPLAALLTLLVCAPDWRTCLRDRLLWPCAAFGVAGFLGCYPRPDIRHIAFAAPLAFPLLAYCVTRFTQRWRSTWWLYRYVVVVVAGVVIALKVPYAISYSLIFLRTSQAALHAKIVPTPRGGAAFLEPGAPELLAQIAATPSSDAYFFYPTMLMLRFLSGRKQVSKYEVFTPDYTSPAQYQEACISVMREASWVVIDRNAADPNVLRETFPAMRDAEPQEKKRFEQALASGFELVAQEGLFELRRRQDGTSDALCAGIAH